MLSSNNFYGFLNGTALLEKSALPDSFSIGFTHVAKDGMESDPTLPFSLKNSLGKFLE